LRRILLAAVAAASVLALVGCDTMGDADNRSSSAPSSPPIITSPTKLSPTQQAAVKDGVRQKLQGSDPSFGTMAATTGSDGSVNVCGYINDKTPYMGTFAGEEAFLVVAMGGTADGNANTTAMCSKSGLTEPYK
jgi:hypothetical protein